MSAYLGIHRFSDYPPPAHGYRVENGAHMPAGVRPKGIIAIELPIIIRIDGQKVGVVDYAASRSFGDDFVDGQDVGVGWPSNGWLSENTRFAPNGPRIRQAWYEVSPGRHVIELAVQSYFVESRKKGYYYRREFDIDPDGVFFISCQYHNKRRVLGEDSANWLNVVDGVARLGPDGVIAGTDASQVWEPSS